MCDARHAARKQLLAFARKLLFLVETEHIELVGIDLLVLARMAVRADDVEEAL